MLRLSAMSGLHGSTVNLGAQNLKQPVADSSCASQTAGLEFESTLHQHHFDELHQS